MAANKKLAALAEKRVKNGQGDQTPGMCQKKVRQDIQDLYGSKFDAYHKGTAHASMKAWAGSPYAVDPENGSVVGDILYKRGTSGQPAGHVGIRVPGNRVAENATRRTGRVHGGLGFVGLEDFGRVDLIVRLPQP